MEFKTFKEKLQYFKEIGVIKCDKALVTTTPTHPRSV